MRTPPLPTRLEWNLRTLVAAYDRAGVKDARWDETARDALTAFAELRARSDTNAAALVRDLVKKNPRGRMH